MPGFREEGDYRRAREVLQAADFCEAAIGQDIGRSDIYRMPSSDVPHVLRRTREPSRLHTLIRLYFLGLPVPEDEVRSALAPVPLEVWVEEYGVQNPAIYDCFPKFLHLSLNGKGDTMPRTIRKMTGAVADRFSIPERDVCCPSIFFWKTCVLPSM